jgi:hypothetical protein
MIPNFITNLKRRRLGFVIAVVALGITWSLLFADAQTASAIDNCMEDVVEQLDGSNAVPLNCTSEDVRVGRYIVLNNVEECIEDEPVTLLLQAELVAGAAERYDPGLYVALDGGDALRGNCYQDYLPPPLSTTTVTPPGPRTSPFYNAEATEDPGDTCGDIEQGVLTRKNLAEITILCQDEDEDGFLDVGTCVSWDNVKSAGTTQKPSCTSQLETRPNTKAKCKCEVVQIGEIIVLQFAHIEVIKDVEPVWAEGLFNLQIDGETVSDANCIDENNPFSCCAGPGSGSCANAADVGDGGTTGKVKVSAGTNQNPGYTHTVGETAGGDPITDLSTYESSIECVDRGLETFDGGAPLTADGIGPLEVPVDPEDDIVCIILNTRGPGEIEVTKTGEDLSKVGDEISYTVEIKNIGTGKFPVQIDSITDPLLGFTGQNLKVPANYTSSTCADISYILAYNESCTVTYPYTVDSGDVVPGPSGQAGPDVVENTVTVVASDPNDPSDPIVDTFTDSDDKFVDIFVPAITFSKTGSPTILVEGTQVSYTITLTGDSSANTPLLDCTITDTALGINETVMLTPTGVVPINEFKLWDPTGADAAYCTLAGEQYECTNTAEVSCEVQGFEGINQLDEEASKTVTVIPADVALSITKDCSDYSKVNTWDGWTAADAIDYQIVITNESGIPLNLVSIDDTVLGNLIAECTTNPLPAGQSCTINKEYIVTQDGDEVENSVTVTFNDGLHEPLAPPNNITTDPPVTCTTDLVHPNLTVEKSCTSPEPVPANSTANFEIKITNGTVPPTTVPGGDVNGDVNLLIDVVDNDFDTPINLTDVLLGTAPAGGCLEGDYGDGVGATPAEIIASDALDGCLLLEGGITASGTIVSNRVDVTATLPSMFGLSNVLTDFATSDCEARPEEGATRTWGFWKTHGSDGNAGFPADVAYGYTCHVFADSNHLNGSMELGWKQVTSCEELFGIFWASKAKENDGSKRDKVCMTQLQGSRQLAAALLNSALDNGEYLDPDLVADMQDALEDGNRQLINQLGGQLAEYNESSDDVAIIDNDGAIIPHADPNGTRDEANFDFADCEELNFNINVKGGKK